MGDVEVNYLAVLLAALSSFVVGMVWYAKPVFGKAWAKLTGMTDEKQKQHMGRAMGGALVSALLIAYVLATVTYMSNVLLGGSFLSSALTTAFWLGLGLQVTVIFIHDGFEQRPTKLSLMNAGNQLANILVMGLIIGLMGV
jgi:hypothetical protein